MLRVRVGDDLASRIDTGADERRSHVLAEQRGLSGWIRGIMAGNGWREVVLSATKLMPCAEPKPGSFLAETSAVKRAGLGVYLAEGVSDRRVEVVRVQVADVERLDPVRLWHPRW